MLSPLYTTSQLFTIPHSKKGDKTQKPQSPHLSEVEAVSTCLDKLLLIPNGGLKGWDGTFIRQLGRWRDIAERDDKEFKLNAKQQAHLDRIAETYLMGGSHE